MPWCATWTRAASKPAERSSAAVASDGTITAAASARASASPRSWKARPRVGKQSGWVRKARSWTVTTSGRRPGGGTARLGAWTRSPGARTAGRRNRCQAS